VNFNDISSMKEFGFTGFIPISELMKGLTILPKYKGVYMILYIPEKHPEYLTSGTGGFFKERNPNVSIDILKENWVENTKVIYIGKAGGHDSSATLNARIKQYIHFGQGKKASHRGGRFIWQLKDSKNLLICWKVLIDEEPRNVEKNLIYDFKNIYKKRPFANLKD
jgi:hypothetical protein